MSRREGIKRVIERSSLGSSAARKLRARTTTAERSQILRKAARGARDSGVDATKSDRKQLPANDLNQAGS